MRTIQLLCLVAVTALGCGSRSAPPPVAPESGTSGSGARSEPRSESVPTENHVAVHIDDAIKKACGIEDSKAYFAFNSAQVDEAEAKIMHRLSDCFRTGALKDGRMRLVGYADPRGESEYNLVLGGERASSVKQFLVRDGVSAERIETTSRGELDASGHDEATWAKDRRVEVRLAN